MSSTRLTSPARIAWTALNIALGLLPSLLLFIWVEHGCTLPEVPLTLRWPWIDGSDWGLAGRLFWDVALFFGFGALHSVFAQARVHRAMKRAVPVQALRTIYMIITGLAAVGMMGFWQSSGIIVWALPLPSGTVRVLSMTVFWSLFGVAIYMLRRLDFFEFVGLRQIGMRSEAIGRSSGTPALIRTGVYGWVRHPIYTFTLSAFLLAPVMTLDRLVFLAANVAYLVVAVPIEERKLVAEFGPAYEEYRLEVPAVLPFWRPSRRNPSQRS